MNFPRKIVYHVTNIENRLSFVKLGASSKFSSGLGQGRGLYVWTNPLGAERHLKYKRSKNSECEYCIIAINSEKTRVDEWIPNFEIHPDLAMQLMYTDIESMRTLPNIRTGYGIIKPDKSRIEGRENIVLGFERDKDSCFPGEENYEISLPMQPLFAWQIFNSEVAGILGPVIDTYRTKYAREFERENAKWFETKEVLGCRYIGKESLPVERIIKCATRENYILN